ALAVALRPRQLEAAPVGHARPPRAGRLAARDRERALRVVELPALEQELAAHRVQRRMIGRRLERRCERALRRVEPPALEIEPRQRRRRQRPARPRLARAREQRLRLVEPPAFPLFAAERQRRLGLGGGERARARERLARRLAIAALEQRGAAFELVAPRGAPFTRPAEHERKP